MSSPSKSLESAWAKGGPSWLDVSVEYGEGQLSSIEGYENAAREQLAPKPKRLAHSLSVGLTAERLAASCMTGRRCFPPANPSLALLGLALSSELSSHSLSPSCTA